MPTFTATSTPSYAAALRTKRDRTDDEIRADSAPPGTDDDVAWERQHVQNVERRVTERVVLEAVTDVLTQARSAVAEQPAHPGAGGPVWMLRPTLDGATITVTVKDLVATATLDVTARLVLNTVSVDDTDQAVANLRDIASEFLLDPTPVDLDAWSHAVDEVFLVTEQRYATAEERATVLDRVRAQLAP